MKTRELYSIEEARSLLGGISRVTLYELLNNGELSSVTIGRRRLIPAGAITAFIATAKHQHRPFPEARLRPASRGADAPAARASGSSAGPPPNPGSTLSGRQMVRSKAVTRAEDITRAILVLRGQKVLLDAHLAALSTASRQHASTSKCGATASASRADFFFELTPREFANLKIILQHQVPAPSTPSARPAPLARFFLRTRLIRQFACCV